MPEPLPLQNKCSTISPEMSSSSGVAEPRPQLSFLEYGATEPTLSDVRTSPLGAETLPSAQLSIDGAAERYSHGKTPHTIFTWWARRPFAAMRGVLVASMAHLQSATGSRIDDASQGDSEPPRVLDVFAGGGTIPMEAARLGAEAYAVENNELAHFLLHSLLTLSQVSPDLPRLVAQHGRSVLRRLAVETSPLLDRKSVV